MGQRQLRFSLCGGGGGGQQLDDDDLAVFLPDLLNLSAVVANCNTWRLGADGNGGDSCWQRCGKKSSHSCPPLLWKDTERVIVSHRTAEYQLLVDLLSEYSKHEVLKNGVRLGKQLVELSEGEETAWKLLAGFWSDPKGHSEVIARGSELITILWAMLGSSVGQVTKVMGLRPPQVALFNVAGVFFMHAWLE